MVRLSLITVLILAFVTGTPIHAGTNVPATPEDGGLRNWEVNTSAAR